MCRFSKPQRRFVLHECIRSVVHTRSGTLFCRLASFMPHKRLATEAEIWLTEPGHNWCLRRCIHHVAVWTAHVISGHDHWSEQQQFRQQTARARCNHFVHSIKLPGGLTHRSRCCSRRREPRAHATKAHCAADQFLRGETSLHVMHTWLRHALAMLERECVLVCVRQATHLTWQMTLQHAVTMLSLLCILHRQT